MCLGERKSQDKAVYQDDLYIASPTPEAIINTLETKYKLIIKADFHLGVTEF